MPYYLQMDGIDDQFKTTGSQPPNLTRGRVDLMIEQREDWHQFINFGGKGINFQSNTFNIVFHADFQEVKVDGVAVTSGTPFITIGQRHVLEFSLKSGITTGSVGSAYMTNTVSQWAFGRLYDIKVYQGDVLAAHYDLTTGTITDQTGNGNTATLIGGTFVEEGGPVVIDKSAAIVAVSTLTASKFKRLTAQASVSGVAVVSAIGNKVRQAAAAITANASVTAAGELLTTVRQASANITAAATITAGKVRKVFTLANIAGKATVTAAGNKKINASAFIVGVSTIEINRNTPISRNETIYGGRRLHLAVEGGRLLHVRVIGGA
jgi:hypothetical protein